MGRAERLILGRGEALDRPTSGPVEGVVTRLSGAYCYFTVPDVWGPNLELGPAKWASHITDVEPDHAHGGPPTGQHEHVNLGPAPGTTVLVVFVGPDLDKPWVLAW